MSDVARSIEAGPAYRACLERDNPEAYQRLLDREAEMSDTDVPTPIVPTERVPTPCEDCGLRPREGRYRLCSACRKRKQRSPGD